MKRSLLCLFFFGFLLSCTGNITSRQKISLFVGIDVSGSFHQSGHYENAISFLAHYLYGHLNQKGELKPLKSLFVGSIGGAMMNEAKSFRPIHDFEGKSMEKIRADLIAWFPESDALTDFNVFFKQVANISKKRNLALSPIMIVLLTDGLPDFADKESKIENIDMEPLEYLARNVTVRLLYASPVAASKWETDINRNRVRMWTVDNAVMQGWTAQIKPDLGLDKQDRLWKWMKDNVDFRVRSVKLS